MAESDRLTSDFARKHPDKFAKILGRGETEEIAEVLRMLPSATGASIMARLPASKVSALLESGLEIEVQWLADAPLDDTIMLLSRIPREACLSLVNLIDNDERRRKLLQYMKYPAHSVGALVTAVPVRIAEDIPANEALAELRAHATGDPGLLVVVRRDGRYLGTLDLWSLLASNPATGLIRDYTVATPALHPETSVVSAIEDKDWHTNNSLPVIDHDQHLLGAVTRASVFSVAEDQVLRERPVNDLFSTLIEDLAHIFGVLLDRIFSKRSLP